MALNNCNKNTRKTTQANLDNICELDLELKQFECPRCNKVFDERSKLFIHMRNDYKNPTTCHICNKNLNALPNVLSHSYIHKNMKPYKCIKNNCKYESRTRFNLKVHLASCAGIAKFKCHKRSRKQKSKRQNTNSSEKFKFSNSLNNILEININPTVINNFGMFNTMPTNDMLYTIPNNDILDEIKNSDPIRNDNRDNTFLIVIHKDHIPPRNIPPSISDQFLYNNYQNTESKLFTQPKQECIQYNQYVGNVDDKHCYPDVNTSIPPPIFDEDYIY